jgi:hypothetical protein
VLTGAQRSGNVSATCREIEGRRLPGQPSAAHL